MKLIKYLNCILLALLMVLSLIACAAEPPIQEAPEATPLATPSTGNGAENDTTPPRKKPPKLNGTFVIGMSAPITGVAAIFGTAAQNAAQMAVDEINAAGGLYGATFKLITTDDQHDPNKVAQNYESMMAQGMQLSLGCVTSQPCLEFATLAKEDNVFFLTPSASADQVVRESNAYQMCFADGKQGAAAADYVNHLGLSKVGILYSYDLPYSKDIYEEFKRNLNDDIVTVDASFSDNANDFSAKIAQLEHCSFIFMPIDAFHAYLFMQQAKNVLPSDTIYCGYDGFEGIEIVYDLTSIPQKITMLSSFDPKATDGKSATFIQNYTKQYGAETLNAIGASAYDCVYAIFGAMKEALDAGERFTPDATPSALCKILQKQFNGGYTFAGVTGERIRWHDTGFVNKRPIAYVIKEKTT